MSMDFFPGLDHLTATGAEQQQLHEQAATVARQHFGKKVFVRAVVEISNFCRENCQYCGMRRDNRSLRRFRFKVDELADLIVHHRPASITDINLQAGEDPVAVREVAIPLIKIIRKQTPLGVSVCLGTLNESLYAELQNAGASIYIIKFETGTPGLYARYESPGTFDERLAHIRFLRDKAWNVSSGFICGLPDEIGEDLLNNFRIAAQLPLQGCSVSPYIAGEATPLAKNKNGSIELALNCMASLRLMRPDWIIPAVSALNLAGGTCGYQRGLATGANLVTINMTPTNERGDYLLYKRDRYIMTEERILNAIEAEGLELSAEGLAEYYRNVPVGTFK
ncbi:MAG: biotin synthase BioB [Limisphaerales bacterium]